MLYKGSCNCKQGQVEVNVIKPLNDFNPRTCDCDYCQNNPSAIISDTDMTIDFVGGEVTINKNGEQIASFYYCSCCSDLLAVGCVLNGQLRGAVNANLLSDASQLGKPIQIQPHYWELMKN